MALTRWSSAGDDYFSVEEDNILNGYDIGRASRYLVQQNIVKAAELWDTIYPSFVNKDDAVAAASDLRNRVPDVPVRVVVVNHETKVL